MNREQHLKLADEALTRAERLAGEAESAARGSQWHKAKPFAVSAAAWADVARAHTAIAAELPTTSADAGITDQLERG